MTSETTRPRWRRADPQGATAAWETTDRLVRIVKHATGDPPWRVRVRDERDPDMPDGWLWSGVWVRSAEVLGGAEEAAGYSEKAVKALVVEHWDEIAAEARRRLDAAGAFPTAEQEHRRPNVPGTDGAWYYGPARGHSDGTVTVPLHRHDGTAEPVEATWDPNSDVSQHDAAHAALARYRARLLGEMAEDMGQEASLAVAEDLGHRLHEAIAGLLPEGPRRSYALASLDATMTFVWSEVTGKAGP